MIKEESVKIVTKTGVFPIIWVIIIHFGMNPRNGGIPPNDRRLVVKRILVLFELSCPCIWER